MIIGVDHIALSVTDIDKATDLVSRWGYRPKFINRRLINSPIKTPYLREKKRFHDISYCQPLSPGLAVELTAHGRKFIIGEETGPYKIVMRGKNPGAYLDNAAEHHLKNCGVLTDVFGSRAAPIRLPEFKTICYYINEGSSACAVIRCILIETFDLDKSAEFWAKFGFFEKGVCAAGQNGKWRLLEFKNYMLPWGLNLVLVKTKRSPASRIYQLDKPGFTCLAFITTDIFTQRRRLEGKKIDVTEISSIEAGGRSLKICLCANPDGGSLELIQIDKE